MPRCSRISCTSRDEIHADRLRAATAVLNCARDLRRAAGIAVENRHRRTRPRQEICDRVAHTLRGARDRRHPAIQPEQWTENGGRIHRDCHDTGASSGAGPRSRLKRRVLIRQPADSREYVS